MLVTLAEVSDSLSYLTKVTSYLESIFSRLKLLIEFLEIEHSAITPAGEGATDKWYLIVELAVLNVCVFIHEVAVFLLPKLKVYLESDLISLFLVNDWINFIPHAFAPEYYAVDMAFTDVAIVHVVRLAGDSILRAFIPLATTGDVFFVT